MIKNIFFDFDGVILDSMKIKGDGFVELFKDYDESCVKAIEEYHYKNGGVSRFDKIRYFFDNILKESISEEEVLKYADRFAEIINNKLFDKSNLIEETIEYIQQHHQEYNLHIVSGAEHNELNYLCEVFGLRDYFITIEGSPTKKDVLVKNLLKRYNYNKDETILIGDAMTDYNASKLNDITFYGYNNQELKEFNYINSFKEFNV